MKQKRDEQNPHGIHVYNMNVYKCSDSVIDVQCWHSVYVCVCAFVYLYTCVFLCSCLARFKRISEMNECISKKKKQRKNDIEKIDFSQKKEPIAFLRIRIIATKIQQTIEPKKNPSDRQEKKGRKNKQEINIKWFWIFTCKRQLQEFFDNICDFCCFSSPNRKWRRVWCDSRKCLLAKIMCSSNRSHIVDSLLFPFWCVWFFFFIQKSNWVCLPAYNVEQLYLNSIRIELTHWFIVSLAKMPIPRDSKNEKKQCFRIKAQFHRLKQLKFQWGCVCLK